MADAQRVAELYYAVLTEARCCAFCVWSCLAWKQMQVIQDKKCQNFPSVHVSCALHYSSPINNFNGRAEHQPLARIVIALLMRNFFFKVRQKIPCFKNGSQICHSKSCDTSSVRSNLAKFYEQAKRWYHISLLNGFVQLGRVCGAV